MKQIWIENFKSELDAVFEDLNLGDLFTNEEILEYIAENFTLEQVLSYFGKDNVSV